MSTNPLDPELRDEVAKCLRRRMRMAMNAGGFDANTLARACGTRTAYVNRWLTGVRVPSASNLRSLSLALGVPADWLLGADGIEMLETLRELPDRILGTEGGKNESHGDDTSKV